MGRFTVLLLLTGGFVLPAVYSQITISGDEEPMIVGVRRDVSCIFNGDDVAAIDWLLVVGRLEASYTGLITTGQNELVMNLNPTIELNGSQFKCRVIDSRGFIYEQTTTITVKELEHSLTIMASISNPVVACSSLTLTCNAVSDRTAHLQWTDPNGNTVTSENGLTVAATETNGTTATSTLTFHAIKTSHAGPYICTCEIDYPVSIKSAAYVVIVQIPAPNVTIIKDPDDSTALFTGDSLTLMCTATVERACIDTSVAYHIQWTAPPSDPPRVNITLSSIIFSSLMSSDTGSYECSVVLSSSRFIANSPKADDSVDIIATLNVEIFVDYEPPCDYEYVSPPFYRPCTNISLVCEAYGSSGEVVYSWSSSNSASFVSGVSGQTVTADMLTAMDGGVHTCCAYDEEGNSGCNEAIMVMKGAGLFIKDSEYISGLGVPDRAIVVPKSSACYNCRLNIYCCSDASDGPMNFEFPDGVTVETSDDYNCMAVKQSPSTASMQTYNHQFHYPHLYGLYSCLTWDTSTLSSIAVYSALPDAPRVYASDYSCNEDPDVDYILEITCSTSDSPPTKVSWCRNGEAIAIDDVDYSAFQNVTDRKNVYYDNILYVKNALHAAGRHAFGCKIENSQGNDTHTIETNVQVYKSTEITTEGSTAEDDCPVLTCTAVLPEKLKELLSFIKLEWVGPYGVALTANNFIVIGSQTFSECETSSTLTICPLKTSHAGLYRCIINISKPSLSTFFQRELRQQVSVTTQALFQLQFGPVAHCATWYKDQDFAYLLECDIKAALVNAINERCNCNFRETFIDMGEMSCHSTHFTAVYRARITSTVYTAPQLLAMVWDWVCSDGTFLFTYNGGMGMRLRLNPQCHLEISSFSEPECGASVDDAVAKLFYPSHCSALVDEA